MIGNILLPTSTYLHCQLCYPAFRFCDVLSRSLYQDPPFTTQQVKFASHTCPRFFCTYPMYLAAVPHQGLPPHWHWAGSDDTARVADQSREGGNQQDPREAARRFLVGACLQADARVKHWVWQFWVFLNLFSQSFHHWWQPWKDEGVLCFVLLFVCWLVRFWSFPPT